MDGFTGLLPQLVGPAGTLVLALLVLWLFLAGKIHSHSEYQKVCAERDYYRTALETERKAVDEYARTGTTTNQLIAALTQVAIAKTGDGHGAAATEPGK